VPTVEHSFAASKTLDAFERLEIAGQTTPGRAKRRGRKVELRPDWEDVKLTVMLILIRDKFTRHPELTEKLLDTGDQELVEGNWWNDTFWGVCKGVGENHLGRILMQVRSELRSR
jgi:ribA/ribD-fused uncharacterized protein